MIKTSERYQAAIVGSPRRVELLAIVDISDPDLVWESPESSEAAPWANLEQLYDKNMDSPPRLATLERGRWLLDGSFAGFPADYSTLTNVGFVSKPLSGSNGAFPSPVWAEIRFSHVKILQMLSIFFSADEADGVPEDFVVDVYSGSTVFYSQRFSGNRETEVAVTGFTVYAPTAIRVTCTKMSLPSRRLRVMEIIPGLYERWPSRMFAAFACTHQGDFSCLSLPYGVVTLSMDNKSRRFEPRRKDGVFQSLEERQGVDVYIGVRTSTGGYEHVRLGLFYMAGDGWKTGDNALTMEWRLVDIIGLLTDRTFIPPQTLPTTLGGWLAAVVAQLGDNFTERWSADPAYVDKPVTAKDVESVTGKKCGDIIRWACQATGTWPRADAETGKLCAEPLWSQGTKITLANLVNYPTMKANQSMAALIFTLSTGEQYVQGGNATSAEQTVTIQNPFIHTVEQAREVSRLILAQYGGNVLELTGRGDPSSEIGDVDTVWLDESNATTARRKSQTIQFQSGVMQNCTSTLLQADGSYMWEGTDILTGSGSWTPPEGVSQLRLYLVGKGQDGGASTAGSYSSAGVDGADGQGGKVWAGVIGINPGQAIDYSVAEEAVFGVYSSASGDRYPLGYSDLITGDSYARSGVSAPLPGSGDGGRGGKGGQQGVRVSVTDYDIWGMATGTHWETSVSPGPAEPGIPGALGCIVIHWDKNQEEGLML